MSDCHAMLRGPSFLALIALPLILASVGGGGACGPLPGDSPRAAAPAPPPDREVVTIRTGDPHSFYLVDTRRELCFFGYRRYPQLTLVPCEEIPEARELLGYPTDGPDAAESPDPAVVPAEGEAPMVGEVEGEEPGDEVPAMAPTTTDERERFASAYVELFCAYRRSGAEDTGPPDEAAIAARHGLDPERYDELKTAIAADATAWTELSKRAVAACP